MNRQEILKDYKEIGALLTSLKVQHPLIVSQDIFHKLFIKEYLDNLAIKYTLFTNFTSNPKYEDVIKGIDLYHNDHCDFIISIGGGSVIDTAKVIKLFAPMDQNINYLKQKFKANNIKHLAIPTTAGTGSEATRYAVIYYEGVKQSISLEDIIPNYVVLEPKLLVSLPLYQKQATLLDALCQGIESYWSINSTDESKGYSKECIALIINNYQDYLNSTDLKVIEQMLRGANLSGKAINITQTTAAHAMSYKLTSLYGYAHGHAVALTLPYIWEYMNNHLEACTDKRGATYLNKTFLEIANCMGCQAVDEAITKFKHIVMAMTLATPTPTPEELEVLTDSVNPVRLKNNPVPLTKDVIRMLYKEM